MLEVSHTEVSSMDGMDILCATARCDYINAACAEKNGEASADKFTLAGVGDVDGGIGSIADGTHEPVIIAFPEDTKPASDRALTNMCASEEGSCNSHGSEAGCCTSVGLNVCGASSNNSLSCSTLVMVVVLDVCTGGRLSLATMRVGLGN